MLALLSGTVCCVKSYFLKNFTCLNMINVYIIGMALCLSASLVQSEISL